jgi:uncharacterized protein (DUF58 family)
MQTALADLLPRLAALDLAVERVLGSPAGSGPGRRRSRRKGEGSEFRGHRAYAPGDELRYVDWNAVARLGAHYVKEFESEQSLQLVCCLDQTASVSAPLAEFGRLVAGVLGFLALSRHDAVDLWAVPGGATGDPFQSRARGADWLQRVSDLAAGGEGSLADAAAQLRAPSGRGMVVLISDCWDLADLDAALHRLRKRRLTPAVAHLVEPPEIAGADGPTTVRDAETGRERRLKLTPSLRTRYREAVERHWAAVQNLCRRRRAAYAHCDRRTDLEDVVFGALVKGGLLR